MRYLIAKGALSRFVWMCLFLLFADIAYPQPSNNPIRIQPTAFWESFSSSIMAKVREEQTAKARTTILTYGEHLVETNQSDPFACKAMYSIGVEFYKQASYIEARKCCERALKLPDTLFGEHISAWNLIAESDKALKDYAGAIQASDEVLKCDGSNLMKYDLQQAALTRKADLLLQLTNASPSDRQTAEAILGPLTEIKNSGPFNEVQGQLVRARIQNFKKMGEFQQAAEVGERFIKSNPQDLYAPLIADDLCTLTNHYASSKTLESWADYFTTNNAIRSAAFANLELDLMNAYAREQSYEKAAKIGQELQNFKKEANDPLPWGEPEKSSVVSVTTVTKGEIEREKTHGILPTRTPDELKNRRAIVLVIMALATAVPLFVFFFRHLKHRGQTK